MWCLVAGHLPTCRIPRSRPSSAWCRYKYLHGTDGDFHNPFDKGCRANCADACNPTRNPGAPFVLRLGEGGESMALLKMEQGGEL